MTLYWPYRQIKTIVLNRSYKLVNVITYIIEAINSHSFNSLSLSLSLHFFSFFQLIKLKNTACKITENPDVLKPSFVKTFLSLKPYIFTSVCYIALTLDTPYKHNEQRFSDISTVMHLHLFIWTVLHANPIEWAVTVEPSVFILKPCDLPRSQHCHTCAYVRDNTRPAVLLYQNYTCSRQPRFLP